MDLALYYEIYRERMDEWVIPEYIGYVKARHLYYIIKNYIWGA